ncbi:MAG: hypothetical protein AABX11_03945 [Nanoarchaeota archaeon]
MKNNTKWIIGIIISILIVIGFFNSPNIKLVRQSGSDYTCPNILYPFFDVSFSNEGSAGTDLCINLNSPNENVSFIKNNDCLFIGSNEQTQFKFVINETSLSRLDNVSIIYSYNYKKWFFNHENNTISCEYAKENNWQFILRSQKTLN